MVRELTVGPLRAKNHLRAFTQLEESIDSITSICTALELRQLNIKAHSLTFSASLIDKQRSEDISFLLLL